MTEQKIIDKVAYILIRDGQILMTRSRGKKPYYIPGGKRESGETDQQALAREVHEELNVKIKPETISYLGTFQAQADGHSAGTIVKMTCYEADYHGKLSASSEIEEICWLGYSDTDKIAAVDKIIFAYLKKNGRLL
ncbi:MAG: NUDIX domain-containing protein [Cyclobacteriaceae bacterium]